MYRETNRQEFGNSLEKIVRSICLIAIVSCSLTSALLLARPSFQSRQIATSPLCGSPFERKRYCSKTCLRATQTCEESCERSVCSQTTDKFPQQADKMQCVAKCFGQDNANQNKFDYRQRQSGAQAKQNPADAPSSRERDVWKQEMADLQIDEVTLQKLCRTSAFQDAQVCRNLPVAQKVSKPSKPTQEAGVGAIKRMVHVKNLLSRRRRQSSTSKRIAVSGESFCEATTELKSPHEVIHAKSQKNVTLLSTETAKIYGYINNSTEEIYRQLFFQVTECKLRERFLNKKINITGYTSPVCRPVRTRHLVDFFFKTPDAPNKLYNTTKCWESKANVTICRGWVFIETSCALYATEST